MSNNLLTISMITNKALMVLENELVFTAGINRDYDDQFAQAGGKIGNTVNVRRPGRFIGTSGPNLSVEDLYESYLPVVVGDTTKYGDQFHVDTQFNEQDLTLSIDLYAERVLKPIIAAVANHVDRDGLLMAKNSTANIVGVAGTPPNALLTYLTAGAYMSAEASPTNDRRMIIEPFTQAVIVDALKGLLSPPEKIGAQYRKGSMGRDTAGMDWMMDQNVISHTFGSWATTVGTLTADTTGAFTGSISSGWQETSTITLTNSQTITLQKGDVFNIANVFATNPQNRAAYGSNRLRNFVVRTAVTAAGGTLSVTVAPAIITAGQFQNVQVGTTSSTATVTPFSIAGTTATAVVGPQNIMYQRNAFTLACVDLDVPKGVDFAGRVSSKQAGLSLRIVRQYTINNDALPTRVDILYGFAPMYQELACRVSA